MTPRHDRPAAPRPPTRAARRGAAIALACLLASSCASSSISSSGRLGASAIPGAIERARSIDPATAPPDELEEVVGELLKVGRSTITSEQRVEVQRLLDASATALSERGDDPAVLEDLALVDMPARIGVPAGLRAARLWFERDNRSDAFSMIRRLDERYPRHALSEESGDLAWAIATSYRDDTRRRLFLFPYSARAPGVFEYLSTEYPAHDKADDALIELADRYEERGLYDLAIERHRDLLLFPKDSPYMVSSEAAIPMLRLDDLDGPEYGRGQLVLALDELELWVARHGDHELRPEVDRALVDCLQRLADNDLVVARFYRRVLNAEGARRHADRGLEFARRAGNAEQEAEIIEFLASVDEIESVDAPRLQPAPEGIGIDSFDPTGTGTSAPTPLAPSEPLDTDSRRRPDTTAPPAGQEPPGPTIEDPPDPPGGQ